MSKVAKAAVGLMIATLLGKILGFGREIALANSYGASSYSDAYLVALNIPNVIFTSIGAALSTTFIPIFCEMDTSLGESKSLKFMNNVLNIVMLICVSCAVLGILFTEPLVKLFAMGFEGETLQIAMEFTQVMMIGIVFIGLTKIFSAYLNIKDNFIVPGLISIPYNLIVIISIILSTICSPMILAYGTLLAMALQCLFQIPSAYKYGYKYELYLKTKDKYLKKMIILTAPVFIGVGVNQINVMVDRTLASTLVEGSISALNYANKLNGFVMGIFIASIVSVIYPMLSKLSANEDNEKFNQSIVTSVNVVILLILPISVGAMILAKPIVSILFERGAFKAQATDMTAIALVFYSIGMIGVGLRDVLAKIFYSLQDTKTPMINGAISMFLNIILNIILVKYMGHAGLALATSLSALICIILLFRSLKKKVVDFKMKNIISVFIKSLIASLIMGIITIKMYTFVLNIAGVGIINKIVALLVSVLIGAIIYGTLTIMFKVGEIKFVVDKFKSKININ